jgi:hypothetical protein
VGLGLLEHGSISSSVSVIGLMGTTNGLELATTFPMS